MNIVSKLINIEKAPDIVIFRDFVVFVMLFILFDYLIILFFNFVSILLFIPILA